MITGLLNILENVISFFSISSTSGKEKQNSRTLLNIKYLIFISISKVYENFFIGKKKIFNSCLVRIQRKVMLYVSSTLLLLVNAVTCRRVKSILFNRVAILILLYSGIICYDSLNIISLDTVIGIYGGLFHSTFKTHSFALFLCIIRAIVFQLTVYYPRRSQKSMGATARKISSLLLTKFTDSYLEIFLNNIIKM